MMAEKTVSPNRTTFIRSDRDQTATKNNFNLKDLNEIFQNGIRQAASDKTRLYLAYGINDADNNIRVDKLQLIFDYFRRELNGINCGFALLNMMVPRINAEARNGPAAMEANACFGLLASAVAANQVRSNEHVSMDLGALKFMPAGILFGVRAGNFKVLSDNKLPDICVRATGGNVILHGGALEAARENNGCTLTIHGYSSVVGRKMHSGWSSCYGYYALTVGQSMSGGVIELMHPLGFATEIARNSTGGTIFMHENMRIKTANQLSPSIKAEIKYVRYEDRSYLPS